MTPTEAGRCGIAKTLKITAKMKQERIDKYYTNPNSCCHCNKILSYKQRHNKFCSNICSANESNNKRVHLSKPKKHCLSCNKEIVNPYFCDKQCQSSYSWDLKVEAILTGKVVDPRLIKKYLLSINTCGCNLCKTETWSGLPILLIMDHIDGDSENNTLNNLRLICSNCDATLPTYKSRNKNSGRQYRRTRYAQGKTF